MNSRVLIIDDSLAVHRLVELWLRPLNVELHFACDGDEGTRVARSVRPDLILLDLALKDCAGLDVCANLRADPQMATTPVVILSAETRIEEKVRALDMGATDYVVKPFEPSEFQARVRAALRMKHLVDLLAGRARIDGLTGLHNRTFFDERLEAEISNARRSGSPLCCIMLDIDLFKNVNDTYGHLAGDEVLRHVGSTLSRRCRREDLVCRYGGEEFAILTPQVDIAGAMTLAEDLRQLVAALELHHDGHPITVNCSFGVSEFALGESVSLAQRADEALYFAKRSGRNRVCPELRFRGVNPAAC